MRGGRQQSSLLPWPSLPVSWTKQGWDSKQTREQWPISHVQSQRSVSGWGLIVSACYRLSPRQLVSACWHDVEEWRWPPHLPTAIVTSCLKKEECFQDKSKLLIVFPPAFYFCSCRKVKSAGVIIFMRHLPIFNIVYSPQAKPSHLYACNTSLALAGLPELAMFYFAGLEAHWIVFWKQAHVPRVSNVLSILVGNWKELGTQAMCFCWPICYVTYVRTCWSASLDRIKF